MNEPNCPVCEGPMWDNREGKKNPRAPDYKCKDKSCDGVIWPPRGGGSRSSPASQAPRQQAAGPRQGDDRSNRIERQHSQEMALRYFAMIGGFPEGVKATDALRDMTSWFQRDVGHTPETAPLPEPTEDVETF